MKWFESTENKLILMTVGIILATVFVGWRFIVAPFKESLVRFENEEKGMKSKESVLRSLVGFEKKAAEYKKYFPETRDASGLIETLNQMANESGISLVSVAPSKSGLQKRGEDLEKMTFSLVTECGYHQLGSFVARIESAPRFIKVQSLVAEPSAARKQLTVNMTLAVFYPVKDDILL